MMKKSLLVVSALAFLAQSGSATEWHVLGARAMGMGGAGVAAAEGAVGAYWNPATLARPESGSGVQIPVGAHAEITGDFLKGANDLNDIAKACQSTPGAGLCQQANIDNALAVLNHSDNGVRADAGLGVNVKVKKVAVFVNDLAYISGVPKVDLVNTAPATLATTNNSKLVLRGLSVTEIGAGYGYELPFLKGLMVGGNLKALVGKAGYYDLLLRTDSPGSSGSLRKFVDGAKTTVQPGVDLGALWDVHRSFDFVPMHPRVGISARNINNPKFNNPDQAKLAGQPDKFSLQGNTRLGVALSPLGFWTVAADADLTRNLTPVDGVASQNAGVGTEINVFNRPWLNIPLRAGLSRNLADNGSKTCLTGGFGLNFLHFMLDASAMVSPARVQVKSSTDSKKVPASLSLGVQIGMLFGGGEEASKE